MAIKCASCGQGKRGVKDVKALVAWKMRGRNVWRMCKELIGRIIGRHFGYIIICAVIFDE